MTGKLPQVEAQEIFEKFLEFFEHAPSGKAKIAAIICCRILKSKAESITEKMYWDYVIKELASY